MAVLRKRAKSKWKDFDLHFLMEWMKKLLFDPSMTWLVGLGLLLAEIVVNMLVIWKIKCEYFSSSWNISVHAVLDITYPHYLSEHVHFVFNKMTESFSDIFGIS